MGQGKQESFVLWNSTHEQRKYEGRNTGCKTDEGRLRVLVREPLPSISGVDRVGQKEGDGHLQGHRAESGHSLLEKLWVPLASKIRP